MLIALFFIYSLNNSDFAFRITFKISEEVQRTCHNSEQMNTWTGNIDLSLNDFIMWDGRDYGVIWGIKLTQLCCKITANYIHKYLLEWPDRPIRIEYSRELRCHTYSSLVFAWFIRYCTVFLQPLCSELDSGPSLLGLPVSRHDEPLNGSHWEPCEGAQRSSGDAQWHGTGEGPHAVTWPEHPGAAH